jgi:hypothetical protein
LHHSNIKQYFKCSKRIPFTGWLEPLLNRISQDENTVAVPLADHISAETFEFRPVDIEFMYMGGFDFDLNFNWRPIPDTELKRRNSIVDSVRYSLRTLEVLFNVALDICVFIFGLVFDRSAYSIFVTKK